MELNLGALSYSLKVKKDGSWSEVKNAKSDLKELGDTAVEVSDKGQSALNGLNEKQKLLDSELAKNSAGVRNWGKTLDSSRQISENLAAKIDLQKQKIAELGSQLDKAKSALSASNQAVAEQKAKLDSAKSAWEQSSAAMGENAAETQKLKEAYDSLSAKYDTAVKKADESASAVRKLATDTNNETASLKKMNSELSHSGLNTLSKDLSTAGEKMTDVGGKLTLGVTTPLIAAGTAAVKTGDDFEAQMSRVDAIAGATGDDAQKLSDDALELGQNTAFSAKEAAEGMENLASAGFSTNEIITAMPGMLNLAASSGEDLATSADIAASTLRGFNLAADQSGHVADVLAKNAAQTNAAVSDTGEAMKYVAPIAQNAGWSLESVTASIGEMANAGIKGSQAGTTLRGMFTQLAEPSKEAAKLMQQIGFSAYDANGKMKPLSGIVANLQSSLQGLTKKQQDNAIATIMGSDALSGVEILLQQGSGSLDQMTSSLQDSDGAAQDMATTMQGNTKGAIEQMNGSIETAAIKLQEVMAPTITNIAKKIEELANKFSQLSPATQKTILVIAGLVAAIGPLILGVGKVITAVSAISGAIGTTTAAITAAVAAGTPVAALVLPILAVVAAITALAVGAIAVVTHWKQVSGFFTGLWSTIKELFAGIGAWFTSVFSSGASGAKSAWSGVTDFFSGIWDGISTAFTTVKDTVTGAFESAANNFKQILNGLKSAIVEHKSQIIAVAAVLGTIFGPALIKTGVQAATAGAQVASGFIANLAKSGVAAMVNGAKIAANFTANVVKSGVQAAVNGTKIAVSFVGNLAKAGTAAVANGAKIAANFTGNLIKSGAQAVIAGAKVTASFVASMAKAAAQAVKTGLSITGSLIKAMISYAADGWKTVASITAQTGAWIAQKAAMAASTVATKAAAVAQKLLNAAMNANPIAIIVTLIAALVVALVLLFNKNKAFHDWVINAWNTVKSLAVTVGNGIQTAFNGALNGIKSVWSGVTEFFGTIWNGITAVFSAVGAWFSSVFSAAVSGIQTAWGGIISFFNGIWGGITGIFSIVGGWFGNIFERAKQSIVEHFSPSAISDHFNGVWKSVQNTLSQLNPVQWGKDLIDGIAKGIKDAADHVKQAVGNVAQNIRSFLHFSVPDEGPLSDADTYGLDFMKLLADTIDKNSDKPAEAAAKVAGLVSNKIATIKDNTAAAVKDLNRQLATLDTSEIADLGSVSGSQREELQAEYDDKRRTLQDEISARKKDAEKEIAEIQRIGKMSKEELQQEIEDRQNFATSVNNLNDEIKDALKNEYEDEEKLQEDHLNKELDNLESWKTQSENNINDVYQKKEDDIEAAATAQENVIQAEIDALDEKTAAESRADKHKEYEDKINDYKSQITYSHDDYNKAQLEKQLASEQAAYKKELNSEAISDKKDALQKQIDAIKTDAANQKKILEQEKQAQLDNIDAIYNAKKTELDNELTAAKNTYDQETTDAALEAQAEQMIVKNNQNEIISLLKSYSDTYKLTGQTLGDKLAEGFKPAIDNIKSMISSITNEISAARDSAISALQTANAATAAINAPKATSGAASGDSITKKNFSFTFNSPQTKSPAEERRQAELATQRTLFTVPG